MSFLSLHRGVPAAWTQVERECLGANDISIMSVMMGIRLIPARVRQRARGVPRSFGELNRTLQLMSVFRDRGWHRSVRLNASVDATGAPLPWFTYPAIEWLSERLSHEHRVFEYGSGNSTLWFANKGAGVTVVEHDLAWANHVRAARKDNIEVLLRPLRGRPADIDAYAESIKVSGSVAFDLVCIDGLERGRCASLALDALRLEGIVILDNSDRPENEVALRILAGAGMQRIDFIGPIPASGVIGCTSVFGRFPSGWTSADHRLTFQGF